MARRRTSATLPPVGGEGRATRRSCGARGGGTTLAPSLRDGAADAGSEQAAPPPPTPPRHSLRSRGEGSAGAVLTLLIVFLQDQIPSSVDPRAPTERNDGRRIELLDDRRARDRRADVERIALVEHRLACARAVEMDRAPALRRGRARCGGGRLVARLILRHGDAQAQPV